MASLRRVPALVVLLVLPVAGCTGGIPTSEGLSVRIIPGVLEFTHVVGRSPCPQLIGRVTVTNTSRTTTTLDFRPQAIVPLSFGAGRNATLEPGQSVTVDVFFTCTSQTSFEVTVDVIERRQGSGFSQFNVRGTIAR